MDEALLAADPRNAQARRDVGVSYSKLGEIHQALAERAAGEAARLAGWREARSWFVRALEVFRDLRSRGMLRRPDEKVIDELTGAVAQCDEVLRGLRTK
jgi:hypothetical protein